MSEPSKPSRKRRWLQNLALSFATFALCVAGLELVLRLNGYGNLEIYQPDATLYWRLKPNQQCYTKVDHKPVRINSRGTRGPEFAVPKPAGTFRILSLGDSRTFGWGLSQEETYSGVLERLLQQKAGSAKRIEIINCGVNAWSYPQMLAYFRGDGLGFQPDMVLLAEANLWTQFSDKNSPQFVKQFMSRVRLKNFLRRFAIYHYVIEVKLKDFYERHRTRFIPVDPAQDALFKAQQQDNPESVFSDAIAGLCSLAVSNGIKPVLLYLPMADSLSASNTPPTLKVKSTISEQMGIPLVDLTPIIKPTGKELYLEADPVHYNARGNELIARRVFEIASPLIVP